MALSQAQLSKKRLKKSMRAKARKEARKSNTTFKDYTLKIDNKFMANCHSLFHTMYENKTIDFTKAPYDIWLHGPAFHRGEAIDINERHCITLVTPGQENDPRLDPIKLRVLPDRVEWQTRKQTYQMNVKA